MPPFKPLSGPWPLACLAVGLLSAIPSQLSLAQARRSVPDDPACPSCSIDLREVRTLGDPVGPGAIWSLPSDVQRDGRGRYWVFDAKEVPSVYDSLGRFVGKAGRKGIGPRDLGGFRGAAALPGDSMLVFDDRIRASVVGPDLKVARVIAGRHLLRPSVILRWPDTVVLNGAIGSELSAGYPLHFATFTAHDIQVQRSFGSQGEQLPMFNLPFDAFQAVAIGRAGNLWASPMLEYAVSRLSRLGVEELTLTRRPTWFPARSKAWLGNPRTPPPPRVFGIREDEDGLVWVFVQIARDRWREAWARVPDGMREVPIGMIDFEKFFDLQIEVLDPVAGRVVARTRLNLPIISAPDPWTLAVYAESPAGDPMVRILRPRLVGRR